MIKREDEIKAQILSSSSENPYGSQDGLTDALCSFIRIYSKPYIAFWGSATEKETEKEKTSFAKQIGTSWPQNNVINNI